MSRSLALLCALTVSTGLAACGGGSKSTSGAQGTTSSGAPGTTTSAQTGSAKSKTSSSSVPSSELPSVVAPSRLPPGAVAAVGDVSVSHRQLDHYILAGSGQAFYVIGNVTVPKDLITDPENLALCVRDVKALEARADSERKPKHRSRSVGYYCQHLAEDFKLEALAQIILEIDEAKEAAAIGVKVTTAELASQFRSIKPAKFPTEAKLAEYLSQRHFTLADLLREIKENFEGEKMLKKLTAEHGKGAFGAYTKAAGERLQKGTLCAPEYLAEGCNGFVEPKPTGPSAAVMIEEITGR